jgi:hypothetical protein
MKTKTKGKLVVLLSAVMCLFILGIAAYNWKIEAKEDYWGDKTHHIVKREHISISEQMAEINKRLDALEIPTNPIITFKQDGCTYQRDPFYICGGSFCGYEDITKDTPCYPNTKEVPLQTAVQMIVDYENLKYVDEKVDTKTIPAHITNGGAHN